MQIPTLKASRRENSGTKAMRKLQTSNRSEQLKGFLDGTYQINPETGEQIVESVEQDQILVATD